MGDISSCTMFTSSEIDERCVVVAATPEYISVINYSNSRKEFAVIQVIRTMQVIQAIQVIQATQVIPVNTVVYDTSVPSYLSQKTIRKIWKEAQTCRDQCQIT